MMAKTIQEMGSAIRRTLRRVLEKTGLVAASDETALLAFPIGHYYSPFPDLNEVKAKASSLYDEPQNLHRSLDLQAQQQLKLVEELLPYLLDFDWPESQQAETRYFLDNDMFLGADAASCVALLRHLKPQNIIEVGCGYSSALMLDASDRYFDSSINFTFIEPYPERLRKLLFERDNASCNLYVSTVQQVPLSVFDSLSENDILFIDTSHVSKVASDVNYLLFEVLPMLKPGVVVHIHDIGWPFEYPLHWHLQGRGWNESYFVRAFLQYNQAFKILLFNQWVQKHSPAWTKNKTPAMDATLGGSLWLQRQA